MFRSGDTPTRPYALWTLALVASLAACAPRIIHPATPTWLPVGDSTAFYESNGHQIRVDVYYPDRKGRYPAVILLHGSNGIHAIAPSLVNRYARTMSEQGFLAYVVHYFDGTGEYSADDATERAHYFQWVADVRHAVGWVRAQPAVQSNHIGLLGHSLGAWLAVGVAAADRRVSRIVLLGSGLEPFLRDSIRHMPPACIIHGDKDDVVPLSDAQELADFLHKRRYPVRMRIYPGEGHTFSDSASADALTRAGQFLIPGWRWLRRR